MKAIKVFSMLPYISKRSGLKQSETEQWAWKAVMAFKNGKPFYRGNAKYTLNEVLDHITEDAAECSAFGENVGLIPMTRSGSSKKSFYTGADKHPCKTLCGKLEKEGMGVFVDALRRIEPKDNPSSASGNRSVVDEVRRHELKTLPEMDRVVLIDDNVSSGATLAGASEVLIQGGYSGEIMGFVFSQTVDRSGAQRHRQPYLTHEVQWRFESDHVDRSDGEPWMKK